MWYKKQTTNLSQALKAKTSRSPLFFRLSLNEQMHFIKGLAILLKAGVPILLALQMLKKQTRNPNVRLLLNDLTQGVEQGQSLHIRLEKYKSHLGEFAINIVKIGEISGTLHDNLQYLSEEIKKRKELRRKVVSALIYPAFIVFATLGITVLLITYVFPKILPVLQTFKGQLPITTRTLIFTSKFFSNHGWELFAATLGLVGLGVLLMRKSHSFRFFAHRVYLKIPLLGSLFKNYHLANFCRTLAVLLKSDVKIVEASKITAKTATSLAYQKSLNNLSEVVLNGGKVSSFLEASPKLFPPLIAQMVTVGESTGKLTDSLIYLAEIYEQEVDEMAKNLSSAIEPLLMVVMGLIVGFIAMSIITPIYSLTQNLSR